MRLPDRISVRHLQSLTGNLNGIQCAVAMFIVPAIFHRTVNDLPAHLLGLFDTSIAPLGQHALQPRNFLVSLTQFIGQLLHLHLLPL